MASSTLLIGDRIVLSCLGGGAEAEYALFEPGDIELRASEPGRVREHGYLTRVSDALVHLEQSGVTTELARRCANAMQPVLAAGYARGAAVKTVATYLRAADLLRSDVYDAGEGNYHGHFLSLVELCKDAGMKGAQYLLQLCHLALLLEEAPSDASVFLATDVLMKGARPGARSFHRVPMPSGEAVLEALTELSAKNPTRTTTDNLPRGDVLEWIVARIEAAPDDAARAVYKTLEESITTRERPPKGPLSDPELWGIELQLDARALDGVEEHLDSLERARGREPGTIYLRSRLALLAAVEPARFVAERVSALALSMTNFHELELLAAEAWLAADEPRRALPYARDLVEAPHIDEGLRMRADALVNRATPAGPQKHKTYADNLASPKPSRPPGASAPPAAGVSRAPPRTITKPGLAAVNPSNVETSPPPPAPTAPPPSVHPDPLPPPPSVRPPLPTPIPPPVSQRPLPKASAPPQRAAIVSNLPPPTAPPTPAERPGLSAPPPYRPSNAPTAFTMELPPPTGDVTPSVPPVAPRGSAPPTAARGTAPPPAGNGGAAKRAEESLPPPPTRGAPAVAPDRARTSHPPSEAPTARQRSVPPRKPTPAPMRRRMSGAFLETRSPGALFADPRAEPDDEPLPRPEALARKNSSAPARGADVDPAPRLSAPPRGETHVSARPARRAPSARPPSVEPPPELDMDMDADADAEPRLSNIPVSTASLSYLQGADQPQYQSERPPPLLPKAPLFPKVMGDEIVEHLSLPPGIGGDRPRALETLPESVLEARIQFTHLARELGLDYRLKRGVELRTDVHGIETIQRALLEMFPDQEIRTREEALEVRRHGALLSELLARRLDAEWIDITPNDPGYWAMVVPPDTRVWPFGRISRFISMGHRERDLVSYFLELKARARGR